MPNDKGTWTAKIDAVREWGGVIEHPADSKAWDAIVRLL